MNLERLISESIDEPDWEIFDWDPEIFTPEAKAKSIALTKAFYMKLKATFGDKRFNSPQLHKAVDRISTELGENCNNEVVALELLDILKRHPEGGGLTLDTRYHFDDPDTFSAML